MSSINVCNKEVKALPPSAFSKINPELTLSNISFQDHYQEDWQNGLFCFKNLKLSTSHKRLSRGKH
jgi:hypothetical protein